MLGRRFKDAHLSGKSAGAWLTGLENEQRMNTSSMPQTGDPRINDPERIRIAMRCESTKPVILRCSVSRANHRELKVARIGENLCQKATAVVGEQ